MQSKTSVNFNESVREVEIAITALSAIHWLPPNLLPLTSIRRGEERYVATRQIKHASSELSKAVESVSSLENQLQTLRTLLRAKLANLTQRLSPASSLPFEVLGTIFGILFEDFPPFEPQASVTDSWRFAIQLSHVCQLWRSVALATKKLWKSIAVKSPQSARLVPLFAKRSAPLRLSVAFVSQSNEVWTETPTTAPAAFLDESLIKDVVFEAPSSHLVFGDATQPRDSEAEPLNSLSLEYDVDIDELQRFSSARIMRFEAVSLDKEESSQLTMPRLEEMVLQRVLINEIPQLLSCLRAPRLARLQIVQGIGCSHHDGNLVENRAWFPALRSLSIINTDHNDWSRFRNLTDSLGRKIVSRIAHLDLTTYHWGAFEAEVRPMLRSLLSAFTTLESLSLGVHPWWFLETVRIMELKPGNFAQIIRRLRTLQLELVSDTFKKHRRPNATNRSKFAARTFQVLKNLIDPLVDDEMSSMTDDSTAVVEHTETRLERLILTKDLVGEHEGWYRSHVQEFVVLEKERILPH
ncbi:hypothetical protein DL93DRAFT_487551 [Clavulina sp. PMI_390]|nr:hypothetical protein DL93DRAFT_487551 [Clavulina sp. PMI_390]